MGRYLQIRVSAATFDPAEVERAWPRLCALGFSPPTLFGVEKGVLELVVNLADRLEIGMLPLEAVRELGPGIQRAAEAKARLDAALAEWNARAANAASDEIEDALNELEQLAKKLKDLPGRD